jgi:hypothetical protein
MFASFVIFPNFAFLYLKLVNQVQWGVRERCSVQEPIGKQPEQSSMRINRQSECAYIATANNSVTSFQFTTSFPITKTHRKKNFLQHPERLSFPPMLQQQLMKNH